MYHLASCLAAAAVAQKYFNIPWYSALAGGTAAYLLTGGWRWARIFYLTFGRDLALGKIFIGVELYVRKLVKNNVIMADIFAETAKKFPNKAAFVSAETGEQLTFKEANELANKMANVFADAGYQKGDVVSLLMENSVEYVPIWLGLTKLGVTVSLLNFNLRGDSLKHCISVADCKAVIYSPSMEASIAEIQSGLKDMEFYLFADNVGSIDRAVSLKKLLISASTTPPIRREPLSVTDKMLYIYTSGTTGLPKAAAIRGSRFLFMSYALSKGLGSTSEDILYNTLPFYHSNGGIGLVGQIFYTGGTVVFRKKFSASRFFQDCHKHNVTMFNYIGETCRYLLSTPPSEFDKNHRVRVAMGNGLRPSIWQEFKDRFDIKLIGEFYGATEGNANMLNNTGKVGAVGYNSVLLPWVYPIKLVRVDKETGEMLRGPDGLSIACQPGELGELVGKVKSDAMHKFDGYVNQQATKKKIAYDIFQKGDSAFMSGDVLIQDELGFYFFQDRTGDTFRWKGENVSTNEVEGVMSKVLKLDDVCVYGVEIPGVDGKAGMAVISDPQQKLNIKELHSLVSKSLPPYAVPVFVRVTSNELEKTTTYKFKKNKLRDEGFDPAQCPGDELYHYSGKEKNFVTIDSDVFAQIQNREVRF